MAYLFAMKPSNRLREVRKARGLSQQALAELSGITQAAISQIENDQRPFTLDWMRTFARIFNCQPADLLSDDDNPDRLTEEERLLLERFRGAQPAQRAMIERVAEPLHDISDTRKVA